jgi:predicted NUDIX family phosphoesterase
LVAIYFKLLELGGYFFIKIFMNQVVRDKMKRKIMVVNVGVLFWDFLRESRFYDSGEHDFRSIVLDHYEYMIRWEAEVDYMYKQPLPYAAIIDEENRVFVYKRWWSKSNAWESRLHEKISFWIWGHVELEDENNKDLLRDSLIREVEEEINITAEQVGSVNLVWYINDDSNDVWKVHFWVFYIVRVKTSSFDLLDWELDNWKFLTIDVLEQMIHSWEYDLETWSEIAFPHLKIFLK